MAVKRYTLDMWESELKRSKSKIGMTVVLASDYDKLYAEYREAVEKVHRRSTLCLRMAGALQSNSTRLVGMRHKKLVNEVLVDWENEKKL